MPVYDYRCDACGTRVEVVHGLHGHGPRTCPSCGAEGSMRKLLSAPAIVFKGSGWAKKDRAATAVPGRTQADRAAESAAEKGSTEKKTAESTTPESRTTESRAAGSKAATAEASSSGSTAD